MIVTHKISMDLAQSSRPCVEAVQDDRYSRDIQIRLTANGLPFCPPEDCNVEVGFTKSDGRSGRYDTMPDGSAAWNLSENLLTVRLAPQVLTVDGEVSLWVSMIRRDAVLSCFPIGLTVKKRPDFHAVSENYVNLSRFLPQPAEGKVGMLLQVEAVDAKGRVTAVSCSDSAAQGGIGGYYIPQVREDDVQLVISYRASNENMPAVPDQQVDLPRGKDGVPGVYLGVEEPEDDSVMVWVSPEGVTSGVQPMEKSPEMTLDVGMDHDGRLYVDAYNKATVDAALGAYIADVDALIGGEG